MDIPTGKRLVALQRRIEAHFTQGDWRAIGLLTGQTSLIDNHPRLLRSLSFGDDDYAGHTFTILDEITTQSPTTISIIEEYVRERYPDDGPAGHGGANKVPKVLAVTPRVFEVPEISPSTDLIAVMMPFDARFDPVFTAIRAACQDVGLRCQRADDVWDESIVIQEVFNLILRAHVVIVDFTGKNPNVMYETGIAHTLGKHVVPITQSAADVPFNLGHHRFAMYLANGEGLEELRKTLGNRLRQLA